MASSANEHFYGSDNTSQIKIHWSEKMHQSSFAVSTRAVLTRTWLFSMHLMMHAHWRKVGHGHVDQRTRRSGWIERVIYTLPEPILFTESKSFFDRSASSMAWKKTKLFDLNHYYSYDCVNTWSRFLNRCGRMTPIVTLVSV